jgi:ParB family chromosome partitioning protein
MPSNAPATSQTTPDVTTAPGREPAGPPMPQMVSVDALSAHPGNVREDLDLTQEFCASVAEIGVRIPLLITAADGGGYRVIEGHRRLAAAVKAGLAELPCVLDPERAGDQAGQYLDMVIANSAAQRKNFTPVQEAIALFAAQEAGATRTRIRRATGRKADDIKTALQAGGLCDETRAKTGELTRQLTLDELALLAEFDDDKTAIDRIMEALRHGYTVAYVAERIRQDRAEETEHQRLRAELEAAGIHVTDELPDGAARLVLLTHDGEDLTEDNHAACPGRGAFFPSWNRLHAIHYCANPAEHGHTFRTLLLPRPSQGSDGEITPSPIPDPPGDPAPDPDRKLVIEGNKAWAAAGEVRKRWLQQLLARRAAAREVSRFVAEQLLTMPEPLRMGLSTAHSKPLFTDVTGQDAGQLMEGCGTCPAARLPLFMLAPIAVAYEGEMTGADASRRGTWRTDRYSPCPRTDAGRYLAFLANLGYQLSAIEQAVADGVPYTGDALDDLPPWDTQTDDNPTGSDNGGEDTDALPGDLDASSGESAA